MTRTVCDVTDDDDAPRLGRVYKFEWNSDSGEESTVKCFIDRKWVTISRGLQFVKENIEKEAKSIRLDIFRMIVNYIYSELKAPLKYRTKLIAAIALPN